MDWLNDVSRIQAKLGILRMTNLGAKTSLMFFIMWFISLNFAVGPLSGMSGFPGRLSLTALFLFSAIGLRSYTEQNIPEPY
jgi:hypothetical protein